MRKVLSLCNLKSSEQAASYYELDDYYLKGESPSEWYGEGAERLGLRGKVEREEFKRLLAGKLPDGQELEHGGGSRRPGVDLTFSAPKSVSLMALVADDKRLLKAHQEAVDAALRWVEENASQARMTANRETKTVDTGNLCVARFEHSTSRELDPQLHTHAVVLNMTQREDGQWRALTNEALYKNKMLVGAVYRSELASRLVGLGYDLEVTEASKGLFEVKGIGRQQLEEFSTRRAQILANLKEKGFDTATAAATSALETRKPKREADRDILREEWKARASEAGIELSVPPKGSKKRPKERLVAAEKVLGNAVDHFSERGSVFTRSELLRHGLERGMGKLKLEDLEAALRGKEDRREVIEVGHGRYTTSRALGWEKETLEIARRGEKRFQAIVGQRELEEGLKAVKLTKGQREAAELILTNRDRIVGIQGYAGTGKTYMLKTVREVAEKAGYQVRGFAPTANAADLLRKDAGIDSETIAKKLVTQDQASGKKELWIVDESSMIGAKSGAELLRKAEAAGARVVLVGDRQQIPAVEAGKPFALLQARGDIQVATMGEIMRQKEEGLKKAVHQIIGGKDKEALETLQEKGSVHQVENREDRLKAVAAEYLKAPNERLMITGTNADRRELNELVREGLREKGRLKGALVESEVLVSKASTEAEKRDAATYREGDVVRFGRDYQRLGAKKGDYATVRSVDADRGFVRLELEGREIVWRPDQNTKVEAFAREKRDLQAGDLVKFTRNDKENDRKNGEFGRVWKVDAAARTAEVVFINDDGQVRQDKASQTVKLDKDRHWEHGYASTIFSAQGRTTNEVIVHVDTSQGSVLGHEAWYVAISRARYGAKVFTDDPEKLPEVISKSMVKESALEALEGKQKETEKAWGRDWSKGETTGDWDRWKEPSGGEKGVEKAGLEAGKDQEKDQSQKSKDKIFGFGWF